MDPLMDDAHQIGGRDLTSPIKTKLTALECQPGQLRSQGAGSKRVPRRPKPRDAVGRMIDLTGPHVLRLELLHSLPARPGNSAPAQGQAQSHCSQMSQSTLPCFVNAAAVAGAAIKHLAHIFHLSIFLGCQLLLQECDPANHCSSMRAR